MFIVYYLISIDKIQHQLLGHLLQVARKVADAEKLDEGYRVGEWQVAHGKGIII